VSEIPSSHKADIGGGRGRVAMYSTPSAYGLVFSWKGRNHTVEQEAPFDANEIVTTASEWADKLENSGLPKGWRGHPNTTATATWRTFRSR